MIALGLGGNVGDDAAIVARFAAVARAFAAWGPVRASPVYRTAPIGPPQPAFLNAALAVRDAAAPTPEELGAMIAETERLLGRRRDLEARDGPRPIDVDVLLWDDRVGRWQVPALWGGWLEVPHPRLAARAFALRPLVDLLGPDHPLPGAGRTLGDALRPLGAQPVERTGLAIDPAAAAPAPRA